MSDNGDITRRKYLQLSTLPATTLAGCSGGETAVALVGNTESPSVPEPRAFASELATLWRDHVPDEEYGAYHLTLSREWEPIEPHHKVPAMMSRQVFGFSAAYLLSGDPQNLQQARRGAEYLFEHAWDDEYGGWYDQLTREGEPAETTKSVNLQLYTNVGLVQYYLVTADERALEHVRRSMEIRRAHGHDEQCGGYYWQLNRDLSVADTGKNKHAHYGYVGSLTLNAYLATQDEALLEWQRELMDLSLDRQMDEDGWIYGFDSEFNRQWEMTAATTEDGEQVYSIGAQLTAALAFLRLHYQTGEDRYLNAGKQIAENINQYGWDERGFFWDRLAGEARQPIADAKVDWWVQIYGCFLQLHLYRLTGEQDYLDRLEAAEQFYHEHLVDQEHGGVFPGVAPSWEPTNTRKSHPWKTSYHELEHELLRYLYHTLWVQGEPVDLHFRLDGSQGGKTHYVSPVDDPDVILTDVTIDGEVWDQFDPDERSVTLPCGSDLDVRVTLASASAE